MRRAGLLLGLALAGTVAHAHAQSSAVNTTPMPFQRAGDPFLFPATTTPQQFVITQPDHTQSYRGVNPCPQADVRIKSVAASMPIQSTPTQYAGVALVTSQADQISATTGTRFVRGPETLGSTPDPVAGPQRVVSIMIVPIPGYTADISNLTCVFELTYGNGG